MREFEVIRKTAENIFFVAHRQKAASFNRNLPLLLFTFHYSLFTVLSPPRLNFTAKVPPYLRAGLFSYQKHTVVVELLARVLLELVEQVLNGELRSSLSLGVENYVSAVHHYRAVSEFESRLHIVRYHKAGEVIFADDALCQLEDFLCRCGVKRRCMLVEKQELGRIKGRHHKRQSLSLTAREQTDRLAHSVLKSHFEQGELISEELFVALRNAAQPAAVTCGEGEIFFNCHAGSGAAHRVLKKSADTLGALVLGHEGNILSVERYAAGVGYKASRYGVEKRGLARAVCADKGYEITLGDAQREIVYRLFGIHRAGIEGL